MQEALTNVAKYAQARRVEIALAHDEGVLQLAIADDGVGVESITPAGRRSYGISGMRERVSALGGEFTLEAAAGGRGTAVRVRIPVPSSSRDTPASVESRAASA